MTQFGRPIRTVTDAGLHLKWPFQSALYFDRRLRVYNPRPSEFLTRDKKNRGSAIRFALPAEVGVMARGENWTVEPPLSLVTECLEGLG